MKKILGALLLAFLFGSCAPSNTDLMNARVKFMNQSPYKLCIDFLSLPADNYYQEDRYEVITYRGIDCSPFREKAIAKKKASDDLWDSAKEVFNAAVDDAYGVSPKSENGKKMVCTTQQIGTSGMAKTTCREK